MKDLISSRLNRKSSKWALEEAIISELPIYFPIIGPIESAPFIDIPMKFQPNS